MTFIQNWCYCEALLDVYEELGIKLSDEEFMMCYHNILKRTRI